MELQRQNFTSFGGKKIILIKEKSEEMLYPSVKLKMDLGFLRKKGHEGMVTCLAFQDGHLYSGSLDSTVRVWDKNFKCINIINLQGANFVQNIES